MSSNKNFDFKATSLAGTPPISSSLSDLWSKQAASPEVEQTFEQQLAKTGVSVDDEEVIVLKNRAFVEFAKNFPWKDECFHQEGEVREIGVWVDVNRVSNISSLDNTFQIQIDIELLWKPLKEEVDLALRSGDTTMNEGLVEFRPVVNIANAKSCDITDDWSPAELKFFPDCGEFYFQTKKSQNAELLESFEFKNFPFDVQDLCIKLVPPYIPSYFHQKVQLVPFRRYGCCCSYKKCSLNDFILHDDCIVEYLEGEGKWDVINIRLKAIRRWEHYVYRLCGILSLVTLTGAIGFRIDLEDGFNDATAYFSTVLLTVVAFMFVVHTTLPAIPYLTILDCFIYAMLVYVLAQMLLLTLFSFDLDIKESFAFWLSVIVWIVIHVIFGFVGYKASRFELEKLSMNSEELKAHMKEKDDDFKIVYFDMSNKDAHKNVVWRKFVGKY